MGTPKKKSAESFVKDIHSHDGGNIDSGSNYPSGFHWDLTREKNKNGTYRMTGDAGNYSLKHSKYPDRVPKLFEIRLNKDKKDELKIFYNNDNVFRTLHGKPYQLF